MQLYLTLSLVTFRIIIFHTFPVRWKPHSSSFVDFVFGFFRFLYGFSYFLHTRDHFTERWVLLPFILSLNFTNNTLLPKRSEIKLFYFRHFPLAPPSEHVIMWQEHYWGQSRSREDEPSFNRPHGFSSGATFRTNFRPSAFTGALCKSSWCTVVCKGHLSTREFDITQKQSLDKLFLLKTTKQSGEFNRALGWTAHAQIIADLQVIWEETEQVISCQTGFKALSDTVCLSPSVCLSVSLWVSVC